VTNGQVALLRGGSKYIIGALETDVLLLTERKGESMTRPVVHFEIRGRDPARLREFYSMLFGWTINADNPFDYGFVEPGIGGPEAGVGGGITGGDGPRILIFVQVADLASTLALAESLGGRRVLEPFQVPGRPTVAQAADPEGNLIGLVQQ
jgi:predicted enzyme related to lactoylglutathione lyase